MEWVETTGRTVEEAKDAALDQLGVAEDDAEIVILEEPRPGLFGRVRGEARVRARVRPAPVRPKEDRRDRRRRGRQGGERPGRSSEGSGEAAATEAGGVATASSEAHDEVEEAPSGRTGRTASNGAGTRRRRRGSGGGPGGGSDTGAPGRENVGLESEREEAVVEEVPLDEQGAEAADFLNGLLDRLGLSAEVTTEVLDQENVEVRIQGEDLGILIGPRGNTLAALQEVTRTVIQRRLGAHNGRLLVDVAGYRQKRKAALERFTREVADQVKATGQRRVLEPMSPPDRKVVHDTINTIEGLATASEGEEPRRRVVILPQG